MAGERVQEGIHTDSVNESSQMYYQTLQTGESRIDHGICFPAAGSILKSMLSSEPVKIQGGF